MGGGAKIVNVLVWLVGFETVSVVNADLELSLAQTGLQFTVVFLPHSSSNCRDCRLRYHLGNSVTLNHLVCSVFATQSWHTDNTVFLGVTTFLTLQGRYIP